MYSISIISKCGSTPRNLSWNNIGIDDFEKVLKIIRQILIVLVGKDSNLYNNFSKLNSNNIILPYSKEFKASISAYKLHINYLGKTAIITSGSQKVGVVSSDEGSYLRVIKTMKFLAQLLEGGTSSNVEILDKISKGEYNLPRLSNTTRGDFWTVLSMFQSVLSKDYYIQLIKPDTMSFEIKIAKD
jgi:hypothetical protein